MRLPSPRELRRRLLLGYRVEVHVEDGLITAITIGKRGVKAGDCVAFLDSKLEQLELRDIAADLVVVGAGLRNGLLGFEAPAGSVMQQKMDRRRARAAV